MKCPQCARKRKYRDGMRCSCSYRFVLDPKRDGMTDGRFQAICRQASGNDTFFFSRNQLVSAYCRRELRGKWGRAIAPAVFGTIVVGVSFGFSEIFPRGWWVYAALVGLVIAVVLPVAVLKGRPDRRRFERCIEKWLGQGREIPRLILEPALHEPPPEWSEPDIYDYGVESLLIVQRDVLVDLFIRNEFHASQRCLVIAESGYPSYLIPKVAEILAQRPDLPVFLLHDATAEGVAMKARLIDGGKLPLAGKAVCDLGIFPADVQRLTRLKPMLPRQDNDAVPVDLIPYAMLISGLSQAIDARMTLAEVIDARRSRDDAAGYDAGGFG